MGVWSLKSGSTGLVGRGVVLVVLVVLVLMGMKMVKNSTPSEARGDNQPVCRGAGATTLHTGGMGCLLHLPADGRTPIHPNKETDNQSCTFSGECTGECTFRDESMKPAQCFLEGDIHELVAKMVGPSDPVLEVGARYGTTSCAVAVAQGNAGAVVSVEPDTDVWAVHQGNKLVHGCAGYSLFGVIGSTDTTVVSGTGTYARQTSTDEAAQGARVTHFTWPEVERLTGLDFNTLIFDCEGCMPAILHDFTDELVNVKTIIVEHDGPDADTHYNAAYAFLETQGFKITKDFMGKSYPIRHVVLTK